MPEKKNIVPGDAGSLGLEGGEGGGSPYPAWPPRGGRTPPPSPPGQNQRSLNSLGMELTYGNRAKLLADRFCGTDNGVRRYLGGHRRARWHVRCEGNGVQLNQRFQSCCCFSSSRNVFLDLHSASTSRSSFLGVALITADSHRRDFREEGNCTRRGFGG